MKRQILYYHGLDSFLSNEKREILERFGSVKAPIFDYRCIKGNLETELFDPDYILDIDIVIGSSLGGLVAYLASEGNNIPCLLFNPALYKNILDWDIVQTPDPFTAHSRNKLAYIVLGEKDDVVVFEDNRKYIEKYVHEPKQVIIEPHLLHQIPVDIFEKHVEQVFQHLNMSPSS